MEKLQSAQKSAPSFPPKEVTSGPVLENVLTGDRRAEDSPAGRAIVSHPSMTLFSTGCRPEN
ncbi:MAG: hypothetical protein V1849_01890 [Chloroflexota bacterium]